MYQTMKDVTEAVKVGDATLIRFSQKIGFNGFSDLKIAIAKEEFTHQYEGDNEHKFYDRILENQIKVLESTRQLLDSEVVQKAIEAITKAKSITSSELVRVACRPLYWKNVAPGWGACEPYR
ncbi:MAG: MurR/RpiR family transcriptional regulator [Trichococcus flocculiformis]|uniref:MurR/RpiR family transcriptional regulator n=1 Tax=Trichococcus flocculiformis TaxID=82803 RepID=A0A847D862_9LACT|nr:hypothetical protein [Trichococcus flocculiformis]NLD32624.1 MurR/RpiR family transcriptional regulator [Trichococcus flocculiformis]